MFNGIIEAIGTLEDVQAKNDCKHFVIRSNKLFTDLQVDDSIAVNGVCLTVTHRDSFLFHVTAVPETLRLTNLDLLTVGSQVNLERALLLNSRLSGHYCQGHVDGVGKILEIQPEGAALLVKISLPISISKYIVNKGYITLDGMSITVIQAEPEWLSVTLIPHTQQVTIVNQYTTNTLINIEVDILSKYVEKILGAANHVN